VVQQPNSVLDRLIVKAFRSHTTRHTQEVEVLSTNDQPVAEATTYTTHYKHKRRTSLPSAGFKHRAASNLRLRLHGHRDKYILYLSIFFPHMFYGFVAVIHTTQQLQLMYFYCNLIVVYVFLLFVHVFLTLSMYSYRCLCILTVVYVFLLFVHVFLSLSMYSYCFLCTLRRSYPDWGFSVLYPRL